MPIHCRQQHRIVVGFFFFLNNISKELYHMRRCQIGVNVKKNKHTHVQIASRRIDRI